MLWLENKSRIYTVADMYDMWSSQITPSGDFLPSKSEVNQDFWNAIYTTPLKDNINRYFVRHYKRFWYYDQDTASELNTVANVYSAFRQDMLDYLVVNAKRYNELFRIYSLTDNDISPINDFHITEEREGQTDTDRTYVSGARTDSGTYTKGSETDTTTNQKMAFNSSNFINDSKSTFVGGQRQDSHSDTFGSQTDTDEVSQTGSSTTVTTGRKDNAINNIRQFEKYWNRYGFVDKIFNDVSKEFLLV